MCFGGEVYSNDGTIYAGTKMILGLFAAFVVILWEMFIED